MLPSHSRKNRHPIGANLSSTYNESIRPSQYNQASQSSQSWTWLVGMAWSLYVVLVRKNSHAIHPYPPNPPSQSSQSSQSSQTSHTIQ